VETAVNQKTEPKRSVLAPKTRACLRFLPVLGLSFIFLSGVSPIREKRDLAFAEIPTSLIKDLQKRSAKIEAREKALDTREARLNILKEEIESMLSQYSILKKEIDLSRSEERERRRKLEAERIARLAKIYQSMPPKQAADRIGKMKESTALGLLRRIKEKVAAKILSNMSPAKATLFSEGFINVKK